MKLLSIYFSFSLAFVSPYLLAHPMHGEAAHSHDLTGLMLGLLFLLLLFGIRQARGMHRQRARKNRANRDR